ncbi:MAG: FHA domain-containing protein [Limnospira sp.]
MITLTLLHPLQSIPVRSWTFEEDTVIRIGRSLKNQVVLYSSVVSRFHVELRRVGLSWKAINLGTNGTYVDGISIAEGGIEDGQILRLAISGPQIRFNLGQPQYSLSSPKQPLHSSQILRTPDAGIQLEVLPTLQSSKFDAPRQWDREEITETEPVRDP